MSYMPGIVLNTVCIMVNMKAMTCVLIRVTFSWERLLNNCRDTYQLQRGVFLVRVYKEDLAQEYCFDEESFSWELTMSRRGTKPRMGSWACQAKIKAQRMNDLSAQEDLKNRELYILRREEDHLVGRLEEEGIRL